MNSSWLFFVISWRTAIRIPDNAILFPFAQESMIFGERKAKLSPFCEYLRKRENLLFINYQKKRENNV